MSDTTIAFRNRDEQRGFTGEFARRVGIAVSNCDEAPPVHPTRMVRVSDSGKTRIECKKSGFHTHCENMELAAQDMDDDNFGLHCGLNFDAEKLGFTSNPTASRLDNVMKSLGRVLPAHKENTQTSFRRNDGFWLLEYRVLDGFVVQRRQDAEMMMGIYLKIFRAVVNAGWSPDEVHFEHPRPTNWRDHEGVFNAPVYFGMKTNALVFSDLTLSQPTTAREKDRIRLVCDALASSSRSGGALTLTQRVAAEIRSQLSSGYPHIHEVAEQLRMTRWTLQRRLAAEGEIFSGLVEETRRLLALHYLQQSHLVINDIAGMLGYSELSAFSRACVRWFDVSPTRMRARPPCFKSSKLER